MHLPLAYKKIDDNQIKVIYCIAPEVDTCSFTKAELEKGIKVMSVRDIQEEIMIFIQSVLVQ
jgi:hypothetical protein